MNHSSNRSRHEVLASGYFTFEDEEPFEYHTRSGLIRRITRVGYSSRFGAEDHPHATLTYHGHNVKQDGSEGARFAEKYPHEVPYGSERSRAFEERKRQIEAAARREVRSVQAREFGGQR